jgi:hypothetical protein
LGREERRPLPRTCRLVDGDMAGYQGSMTYLVDDILVIGIEE